MCARYSILAFLIFVSWSGINAKRSNLNIEDDRRAAFLVEPFCFAEGGYLDLQVLEGFYIIFTLSVDFVEFQVRDFVLRSSGKEVHSQFFHDIQICFVR